MAVRDDFTAGEVLAAADLNDTFASKLPYSFGTATPSTTESGFLWYDSNSAPPVPKYWDGAAFQIMSGGGGGGLVYITETTFATVSSVSINNCFTNTYRDYRLLIKITSSTNSYLDARLRASGSDITASNYYGSTLAVQTSTVTGIGTVAQGRWTPISAIAVPQGTVLSLDLYAPEAAETTFYVGTSFGRWSATSQLLSYYGGGIYDAANQADGITLSVASGTITGNIRIYGYENP